MKLVWRLPSPSPFDLASTVLSHGFYQVPPFHWDFKAQKLFVALRPPLMLLTISNEVKGRGLRLNLSGRFRGDLCRLRRRLEGIVAHVLDFDRDLHHFYKVCRTYRPIAWVPGARAGRLLRCPDVFADVVVSICGTNTQWRQAVRSARLLSDIAPRVPGTDLRCFPTPTEILRAGERFLVDHARVGYRSRSIIQFCRKVSAGEIDLRLPVDSHLGGGELRAFFRSIDGIGPVTARYLATLHHRADELAVDSLVLRYIGDKYHGGRSPSIRSVEERYAPFGDYRALAYWFEILGDVDPVTWRGWKKS